MHIYERGTHSWYSVGRQISWIALPGIMFTGVLTMVLQIVITSLGSILLTITVVNFFLYLGLGLTLRKLVGAFGKLLRR